MNFTAPGCTRKNKLIYVKATSSHLRSVHEMAPTSLYGSLLFSRAITGLTCIKYRAMETQTDVREEADNFITCSNNVLMNISSTTRKIV